jgi:hypothetical protein
MQTSPTVTELTLLERIAALPECRQGNQPATFTAEQDEALLKYWKTRRQDLFAAEFGYGVKVCRERYNELTKEN